MNNDNLVAYTILDEFCKSLEELMDIAPMPEKNTGYVKIRPSRIYQINNSFVAVHIYQNTVRLDIVPVDPSLEVNASHYHQYHGQVSRPADVRTICTILGIYE